MKCTRFGHAAAVLAVTSLTAGVWAAQAPQPTPASAEVTEECLNCGAAQNEGLAVTASEELRDTGFERYVDLFQVSAAWLTMDAPFMTDLAMQMAEGERILQRSHKSGITSAKLLSLAVKIAGEKRDATAIQRLKAIAENSRNNALAAQVSAIEKLAATARAISAGSRLSVETTSDEEFSLVKDASEEITRLRLAGDAAGLREFKTALSESTELSVDQRTYLEGLTSQAINTVGESSGPADEMADALRMLAGDSRGTESNRNEVRSRIAGGGWDVVWGVELNEGEYAKFLVAIVAAIATENPAPIEAYFKDYLQRTWNKVQTQLPGVAANTFYRVALNVIKNKSIAKLGKFDMKGGIATYNSWQVMIYDEPRTRTAEKEVCVGSGRFKVCKKVQYPEVYTERVTKRVDLPNKHQPYFAFRVR